MRHTLKTKWGMVCDGGKPQQRPPPYQLEAWQTPEASQIQDSLDLLKNSVKAGCLQNDAVSEWFRNCVIGCTSSYTLDDLKNFFIHGNRIDIEVMASVIVSFLGPEVGSHLVPHLSALYEAGACMWMDKPVAPETFKQLPVGSGIRGKFKIIKKMLQWKAFECLGLDSAEADAMKFLETLLKVRQKKKNTVLNIPNWVYVLADVDQKTFKHKEPVEFINLSRHPFRVLQKWLTFGIGRALNDEKKYCRTAGYVEKRILGLATVDIDGRIITDHVRPILETKDPLALAFSFSCLQRILQCKVVSNMSWTAFLKKGETVWQNQPNKLNTFQLAILEMIQKRKDSSSTDHKALNHIQFVEEDSEEGKLLELGKVRQQIDDVCLMLEKYVELFGKGDYRNLVSTGLYDSSGAYNSLCDSLQQLKLRYCSLKGLRLKEAEASGEVPGHVQRFLALDIMFWNDSHDDDAFAGGRVPGWATYLAQRRLQNFSLD